MHADEHSGMVVAKEVLMSEAGASAGIDGCLDCDVLHRQALQIPEGLSLYRCRSKHRGQRGELLLRPAGIFGSVDEPDEVAVGHVQTLRRRISGIGEAANDAWGRLLYRWAKVGLYLREKKSANLS